MITHSASELTVLISITHWPVDHVYHHLYFIICYLTSRVFTQLDCAPGAHRLFVILPSTVPYI